MCMALVAETSVVVFVYGLGGRDCQDLSGHGCIGLVGPVCGDLSGHVYGLSGRGCKTLVVMYMQI